MIFNLVVTDVAEVKWLYLLINKVWKSFNTIFHITLIWPFAQGDFHKLLTMGWGGKANNVCFFHFVKKEKLIIKSFMLFSSMNEWSAGGIAVNISFGLKKYSIFISVPVGADILTHLSVIYSVLDRPGKVMHFAWRLCRWGKLTYTFSFC